jgi:GNAT superfamily N-acetyltransferase
VAGWLLPARRTLAGVTVSGITFLVRDGAAVASRDRDATATDDAELLSLRAEVCGASASADAHAHAHADDAARQLRVRRRQPGFVLAEARHGGYLVGYAAGLPLRPSTSWWKDLTTPLPADLTTEYPGRTFAIAEFLVRASWRRQGIGRTLHDLILDGRPEERATATIPPGAAAAQAAFRRWGWRRIARTRALDPGAPALDVLVTDLLAGTPPP